MRCWWLLFVLAFAVGCVGAANTPDPPGTFNTGGLRLVIGVERQKTLVVKANGEVDSSETGQTTMKFVGQELKSPDESTTLLTVDGDTLRSPKATVGSFQGGKLSFFGDTWFSVRDDGTVYLTRDGADHKLRMHFDGSVQGHKRPALMLVAVFFSLFVATNPSVTLDRFYDD